MVLAALAAALGGQARGDAAPQVALRATEFGEAWGRGDVAGCERLLATRYTHTDVSGQVQDRAGWLAYLRARRGSWRVTFSDVRTDLLGDAVAVVTGENQLQPEAGGAPVRIRFTQVWIREQGAWMRTFFQATPIVEAKRN